MLFTAASLAGEVATVPTNGAAVSVSHFVDTTLALMVPLLKAVGAVIIFWGVICAAVRMVGMEVKMLRGRPYHNDAALIRQHLGYYLLLGLNFIIALDVIETLLHPSLQELAILAGLVVLRTVMGFGLQVEMREIRQELNDEGDTASRAGND